MDFLHQLVDQVVAISADWGLFGVFALMFIESSLFPFPSEIVMIPAGINAAKGDMSLPGAIIAGTLGSLAGAYFNYYLAILLGRPMLERYGKYLFLPPEKFEKACAFFDRHGAFGTFTCRFIPGIRQLISIPAGLARLSHWKFSLCTTLGAGLWVAFLAGVGYVIGDNYEEAKAFAKSWTPAILVGVLALFVIYAVWLKLGPPHGATDEPASEPVEAGEDDRTEAAS